MTFDDYVKYFAEAFLGDRPKDLRAGQWAFIVLQKRHLDIATEIVGTDVDPFYRDDLIPSFLGALLGRFVKMKEREQA